MGRKHTTTQQQHTNTQRAERLQKLTDEERQRIGLPPRNTTLTDEQRAALPEDYAEAL